MRFTPLFILLALTISFTSCSKLSELENATMINSEPEFAVPLVNTKIKVQDFFDGVDGNFFLTSDSEDLISFNYKGKILTKTGQEIIDEAVALFPPFIPLLDTITSLPMVFNKLDIDRAQFKGGTLQFGFNLPGEDFNLELTIPSILDGETPFTFSYEHIYSPSEPEYIAFDLIDISGYYLQEQDDSLRITYQATNNAGEHITLNSFLIKIQNVDFSYLQGYLGNHQYDVPPDTIKIKFFENIEGGVYFKEPKIYVDVLNSFGVPTRSLVNIFQFRNNDGSVVPLESTYIDNGIDFAYPTIDEIGVVRETNFQFHKDNSNIADIIALSPIALEYDVDAITNPDSILSLKGFITDSSFYTINMAVELPLYGFSQTFTQEDTVDLKIDSLEHLKSAEIKLITENRMPIDIKFQAYFLDNTNTVLDSLLTDTRIIKSAGIDEDGQVSEKNTTTTFISLDEEKLEHITQAKNIVIKLQLSTLGEGAELVKITLDQDLEIRMGLKAILKN